jgi:hypothetical protein
MVVGITPPLPQSRLTVPSQCQCQPQCQGENLALGTALPKYIIMSKTLT